MKLVAIRADASTRIGTGHIMRCLTLAKKLKNLDCKIIFLCKQHNGHLNHVIKKQGFELISLSAPMTNIDQQLNDKLWLGCEIKEDAQECMDSLLEHANVDLLIVDHYSLDHRWHNIVKQSCKTLMVIDDLKRTHNCDILLDQTYARTQQDYINLVPNKCELLLGEKFMLLRDEFINTREFAKTKRSKTTSIKRILISLGGTDPDNIAEKIINWLLTMKLAYHELTICLVVNPASKYLEQLRQLITNENWIKIEINPKSMAKLILDADLAIGSSGASAWERCCLGLPTLAIISAKNQLAISNNLNKAGAIINIGWFNTLTFEEFKKAFHTLFISKKIYQRMAINSFSCCDGLGTEQVAEILKKRLKEQ